MERTSSCTCGLLAIEAKEVDKPVTQENDGKYYLHLTAQQRVEITACRLCGGYEKDEQGRFTQGTPCTCGTFARWAADPDLPVRFDEQMNEYMFEYNPQGVGIFYYCVVCGGRLPKSKRGLLFMEPTQADVDDFYQRTSNLKTIDEVIALLGQPDAELSHEFDSCVQDRIHLKRQIGYENVWASLVAVFQEGTDGLLNRFSYGKSR